MNTKDVLAKATWIHLLAIASKDYPFDMIPQSNGRVEVFQQCLQ